MLCVLFVTKINHIFIYAQVIRIQISKCVFSVYQLFAHLSSIGSNGIMPTMFMHLYLEQGNVVCVICNKNKSYIYLCTSN